MENLIHRNLPTTLNFLKRKIRESHYQVARIIKHKKTIRESQPQFHPLNSAMLQIAVMHFYNDYALKYDIFALQSLIKTKG